jgi:hypothetical protein
MFRSLAAITLVAGLAIVAAPAHAKPDPIRGFQVTVKDEQIRASALIPGPVGRKAQLQQFDAGRWVNVATARTKRTQGIPRARWRVDISDLRQPSAQSRAQAGPLAELIRLRAQADKAKSKPQKVRVSFVNPLAPKIVSGFVGSQIVAPGLESLWSGQVRYEAVVGDDGARTVRYRLASASITWSSEGAKPGCVIKGGGTFTEADLVGEGFVEIAPRAGAAKMGYNFTLRRLPPVTLTVTCGNDVSQFESVLGLYLNTLDCPSASQDPGTVPSTYTGQPWSNRKPPFVFFGKVGLNAGNFCSNTLQPPGIFQSWDLTGSELFEFDDFLSPISK